MKLFLLSLMAVCFAQLAKAQTPTITGFNGSSATVCSGSMASFTATIGNTAGIYTYTLTNGSSPISGTASTSPLSQTLTTSGTGTQTFTLTVSSNGISTSATNTLTVGSHPDYQPLVDLYNSTNGPGWYNKSAWLKGCDPCKGDNGRAWYGVTCTNGRVTRLILGNNQLTGIFPVGLGALTELQELHLYRNQLFGEISSDLGSLAKLKVLYLHGNRLTGSVPDTLGSLTNLQELALAGNSLTGIIPSRIGLLAQLQSLNIGGNQLILLCQINLPSLP